MKFRPSDGTLCSGNEEWGTEAPVSSRAASAVPAAAAGEGELSAPAVPCEPLQLEK